MTDLVSITGYEPSAARVGDRFTLTGREHVVTSEPGPAWLCASATDASGRPDAAAAARAFAFFTLRESHATFHLRAHPDRVVGLRRNIWRSDWQTSAADLPRHATLATIALSCGGRVRAGWLHPNFSTLTLAGGSSAHGLFVLVDDLAYGSENANARTRPGIAAGLLGAELLDGGLTPAGRQLAARAARAEFTPMGPLWCELLHTELSASDSAHRAVTASVLAELAPTWTATLPQLRTVLNELGRTSTPRRFETRAR